MESVKKAMALLLEATERVKNGETLTPLEHGLIKVLLDVSKELQERNKQVSRGSRP